MKKLLAMLLSLVMLFALPPFTFAEDADFTLVIKGGDVNDNLDNDGNLAVDVFVNAAIEEPLTSLTFDLTYDSEQLTYVDSANADAFDMAMVNGTEAGIVRCAIVSMNGVEVAEETKAVTLLFKVADDLEPDTEIAFALSEGGYAETDAVNPVNKSIDADFSPFVYTKKLFKGTVKFNEGEVEYSGTTASVIWDCEARLHTPAFTVYDEDGETVVDPENYDYEYKENDKPGTGYLFVYFKNEYTGQVRLSFKIYLPATTGMTIANVANGIRLEWDPVEDAAGYVIYRRAWNLTDGAWTEFARWDNTTELTYLDGHDASHKVYAGTRYQYGVKAYFTRRTDPIVNQEIGGNVNNPSGNFNLGKVGPLKTTVRITTRTLSSVTAGTKQLTVKWVGSSVFTGYQIQYATNAAFTQNSKNFKVEDPKTYQTVIKELTSGSTYYVRIRSYQLFEGMNYYGEWSNVLSATVK